MKKRIFVGVGILVVVYLIYFLYMILTTRSYSPAETKKFSYNGLEVKLVYARPYKKGRLIFGEEKDAALVPHGKYWRLGANEATEITFSRNINFAGKPIQAGSYRMYAVPNVNSWDIFLNNELGKWGYFEPDYDLDVVKAEIPVTKAPSEVEQLTINFTHDSTRMIMDVLWDKTVVSVPITIQ